MISVHFQGRPFNITVIKSMPWPIMLKSWSWRVLWRPTRPSRTNTQKKCPFHYRGLECKSRKSRATWSDRQIGLGVQNEAGQRLKVLPREHTGYGKHHLVTTQEKSLHMDITRWSIPKQIHYILCTRRWRSKIYIVSKNKTRSWLWLRSWTPCCQIQT